MTWENERPGFVKIAEGEEKRFKVLDIQEKKPSGKIMAIPGKDYLYEFITNLGTLTVNNVGLFMALTGAGVRVGDTVRIEYIKKGSKGHPSVFKVEVVEKGAADEAVPF